MSQVSPKSDHFFSLLCDFFLGMTLIVLTLSVDLLTCWIWVWPESEGHSGEIGNAPNLTGKKTKIMLGMCSTHFYL